MYKRGQPEKNVQSTIRAYWSNLQCMDIKITRLVGPPHEIPLFDNILAGMEAVAISPFAFISSEVIVGKNEGREWTRGQNSLFNA